MIGSTRSRKYNLLHTQLKVDTWKVTYDKKENMIEELTEKTIMEDVNEILYLGVIISCDGKNTKNINYKRNKSIGTHKQITNMVKGCGKYTIECGFIYPNSILRGSILYGAESMLNIKEDDYRKIEQIEEQQMRLLFSTERNCSIHLLYLESGQIPARYQIKRMILNYYHYILQQPEKSLLYRMLMAQMVKPVKNDFHQTALAIINEFDIRETQNQIKHLKRSTFSKIVKGKCIENAFKYLKNKQEKGSKGSGINYTCLAMADYLCPEANMTLKDQREIFLIRCRTNSLSANRGIIENCETMCGEILDNSHIFQCKKLNTNPNNLDIENILNGYLNEKKEHLKIWRENMEKRNIILRNQLFDC